MHIVVDLLVREVAMLGILSAVGSGVAAFLPSDGRVGSRVALAPALGLALASAVLTTAGWFLPMKSAAWAVLLPVALVSAGVAAWRWRRGPRVCPSTRVVVSMLIVAAVTLTALNWPLVARDSLGPVAYQVYDAEGYVSEMQADRDHTIADLSDRHRTLVASDGGRDLSVLYGSHVVQAHQQVGYSEVSAAVVELFGWEPSSSQSAFLSVLFVVGGFGGLATVMALTRRRSWPALVGGLLFAGPLFYELFLDGSEAAAAGLAILPCFVVVGACLLERIERWAVVALGGAAAGLLSVYPPLVPPVVVSAGVLLVVLAILWTRQRRLGRRAVLRALAAIAGVGVVAAVLAPVALYRALQYWSAYAQHPNAYVGAVPVYKLPVQVLPGWLLQTREFYALPSLAGQPFVQWFLAALVPLVILGVVTRGFVQFPRATIVLALVVSAAVLAYATYAPRSCTYCVQRTLLIIAPVAAIAVAVGLQAIWDGPRVWWRIAAGILTLGILVVAGDKTIVGVRRAINGAYMLPADLRTIQSALHKADGPVYLEAIGQGYEAPIEFPATYEAANEATRRRLAVSMESNDYAGLAYVGAPHPPGPEFTPDYRWVLTRAQGIATPRTRVARAGPFALERRTAPLDVTITSGVALDTARDDPRGRAWVQGPMTFWVSGPSPKPIFVRMRLTGSGAISVADPPGTKLLQRTRSSSLFCVPVPRSGTPGLHRVTVTLNDYPVPLAMERSGRDLTVRERPGKLLRLAGMAATSQDCRR
jgi:hypothetical protein